MSDNNMSEEDYLRIHLEDLERNKRTPEQPEPTNHISSDIPFNTNTGNSENTKVSDLQYFHFDIKELPCGQFYPQGTVLMIRPAQVREIQAYSMVDDNNFYDIVEKMNDMLQSCVRVKYVDGKIGSFLDIKDQDRLFIIFAIRELTFQQGNSLSVNTKCGSCGIEETVELKRSNFAFHEIDEKLAKFYNKNAGCYQFKTINGKTFELTPPNIGLQKAFTDYIIKENNDKRSPNLAFLKIIPFMLGGRSSITYEGIKAKLREFEEIDGTSFQFLNSAVGKMTFGIKELSKTCQCGEEIRTEMQFPNGASGIFVIHDAFEAYIKE
jgi:hypothetical protein